MKHFVQYHNAKKMGYPCECLTDFHILTSSNSVSRMERGDIVWLIGGQGTPRTYSLCNVFIVDGVERHDGKFTHRAYGTRGAFFPSPLPIDRFPWFHEFLLRRGNFGLGFQELNQVDIQALQGVVKTLIGDASEHKPNIEQETKYPGTQDA